MIKLDKNIKYVFFDVDGILSAPCYYDDEINEYVIGFSDEKWNAYLENEGIYTYKYCKPVNDLLFLLNEFKTNNIHSYVLSTIANSIEADAKTLFIDKNYPDLFDEYFYVEHDFKKASLIQEFAKKHNISTAQCMIIDDTYSILLDCHVKGICACHISNILADNISK